MEICDEKRKMGRTGKKQRKVETFWFFENQKLKTVFGFQANQINRFMERTFRFHSNLHAFLITTRFADYTFVAFFRLKRSIFQVTVSAEETVQNLLLFRNPLEKRLQIVLLDTIQFKQK